MSVEVKITNDEARITLYCSAAKRVTEINWLHKGARAMCTPR